MDKIVTNNDVTNENTNQEQSLFKQIIVIEDKKKKVLTYILKLLLSTFLIAISIYLLYFAMKTFDNASKEETIGEIAEKYMKPTLLIWACGYLIVKGITGKTRLSLAIVIGIEKIENVKQNNSYAIPSTNEAIAVELIFFT